MAKQRAYDIIEERPGKEATILEADVLGETGGLVLRSRGFNVKRNQSVKTCKRKNGKVRRIVKAKPVKG